MRAFLQSLLSAPRGFLSTIIVAECLLLFAASNLSFTQIERLQGIDRQLSAAKAALDKWDYFTDLSELTGECTLASVAIDSEAQKHLAKCERLKSAREQHSGSSMSHAQTKDESTRYEDPDRSLMYAHQLDELFSLYVDSGIQLNNERGAHTTGRLALVHLPEIYTLLLSVRDGAILAHNAKLSYTSLLRSEGALNSSMTRAVNTFQALLSARDDAINRGLAENLEVFTTQVAEYFQYIEATKFVTPNRSGYQRDLLQLAMVNPLADQMEALMLDVSARFTEYLNEERRSAENTLWAVLFFTLALQILLLMLLRAVAHSSSQLRQASFQLTEMLAKQDKMFAIIGHELRTPAAAMKMQLDELVMAGDSRPALKELCSTSQHLLDVLDDMRVGSGQSITGEFTTETRLSVYKICQEAIHSLNYMAEQHKVELDFDSPAFSDVASFGRQKQVRQIVINLVKNAIIHAEASRIDLRLRVDRSDTNKTAFVIDVQDNGRGISTEHKQRLFQAYERGPSVSGGTGLGLHVSRELARTLEAGDLEYLSPPDGEGGSIFRFSFTLENAALEDEPALSAALVLQGKRVLLVEDTPTLLMLGHTILTRAGAEVTDASDGAVALAKYREQEFDIIITDIMMPVMDGYELTKALRAEGFSKPIIGVTGATVGNEADRLLESGATAVLPKPLTLNNLKMAIDRLNGISGA